MCIPEWDWSFVCSVTSAVAAVISAIVAIVAVILSVHVAYKQGEAAKEQTRLTEEQKGIAERQAAFELEINQREERRHANWVDAEVCAFLQKHSAERWLMPLCFAAFAFDKTRPYHRELYRDFCCLTNEVQCALFEREGISLRVGEWDRDKSLFSSCVDALKELSARSFPDDDSSVLYDNGKYLRRCLAYGEERVDVVERGACSSQPFSQSYGQRIIDVLSDAFDGMGDYCHEPISLLMKECSFAGSSEIEACLFVAELCMYLATLGTASEESEDEYGSLDDYFASGDCTMEDLFLRVLFEVYVRLLRRC